MSERLGEPTSYIDADPDSRDQIVAEISAGRDVWAPRNFEPRTDMNDGLTLDFWRNRHPIGYLEGHEDYGFMVYGPPYTDTGSTCLTVGEPADTVYKAKQILEDYLKDASL